MTPRLLLDTHIVLWLESGDPHLRPSTRALIDACWHDGGVVQISAVTAWEIAALVDGRRIDLDLPPDAWIERFLARPGIEVLPLDHRTAARTYGLEGLEHRDPADRMLIATAIEQGCPLVTYDVRITDFASRHGARCGFAALA